MKRRRIPAVETVDVVDAAGRVLAQSARADRDYPPLARSIRDGFAVRAADLPGELRVTGEVRAGEAGQAAVGPGEAIEIMTGAPVPEGADAIVMVEHVARERDRISTGRAPERGEFINPRGSESRAGSLLLTPGKRMDFSDVALLATIGITRVNVYAKPRVAILSTGDEIVEAGEKPLPHQVRNSNSCALAALVTRAGGVPEVLPIARDNHESTREGMERGLASDLLLISGGVSAGKYDLVESVLADVGAQFFFDRVLIQPGQPLVFGFAHDRFFFGLPGNPASTMVTFSVFAAAALELISGAEAAPLRVTLAHLTEDFRHRAGLTRFLPALLAADRPEVTPLPWRGSSDVPALCRANAFMMVAEDRESWRAGELIPVLPK